MSEHIDKTIRDLQAKIDEHEKKAAAMRMTVNSLCEMS